MEKSRNDLLRRVLIRPAAQIGVEDESVPYYNQHSWRGEMPSNGPVDNSEILEELRRIRALLENLSRITTSLARLEGMLMVISARLSRSGNVQTVSPVKWGQKQDQARQLLLDLLAKNPKGVDVKQIRVEAAIRGISMQTMKMVKKSMGLKAEKHGTSWMWKLPDSQ